MEGYTSSRSCTASALAFIVAPAVFALTPAVGARASADRIGYHEVKLDAGGRIVPWYGTGPSQAYDQVVRLIFDFWHNMRNCPNGVPYYLQHQVWRPNADDPRGLGGDGGGHNLPDHAGGCRPTIVHQQRPYSRAGNL